MQFDQGTNEASPFGASPEFRPLAPSADPACGDTSAAAPHASFDPRRNPFEDAPSPDFFCVEPSLQEAYDALLTGVLGSTGFFLVTGEAGIGKTSLLLRLAGELRAGGCRVLWLPGDGLTTDEVFAALATAADIAPPGDDRSGWLRRYREAAAAAEQRLSPVILVIDAVERIGGDALCGIAALLTSGLGRPGPLRLVLGGSSDAAPIARAQLGHEPRFHLRLTRLGRDGVAEFIACRLRQAGCPLPAFSGEAVAAVAARSGGVPRRINRLCLGALLLAGDEGASEISVLIVDRAARELDIDDAPEPEIDPGPRAEISRWPARALATWSVRVLTGVAGLVIGFLCFAPGEWTGRPAPPDPPVATRSDAMPESSPASEEASASSLSASALEAEPADLPSLADVAPAAGPAAVSLKETAAPARSRPTATSRPAKPASAPASSPLPPKAASTPTFRVQLGAFRVEANARSRCAPAIEKGYPLTIAREKGRSGNDLFFCRSRRPLSRAAARALVDRLRADLVETDVVLVPVAGASERSVKRWKSPPGGNSAASAAAAEPVLKMLPDGPEILTRVPASASWIARDAEIPYREK